MDLKMCLRWSYLSLFLAAALGASPTLRLSDAAVGPLVIAVGANAPAQTAYFVNSGDGSLNLTFSSSASWLSAALGTGTHKCTLGDTCHPIQITLSTTALTEGIYTGVITVSDANAIDAPQTISVTVQAGGQVPDKLTYFVTPNGGKAASTFKTFSKGTVTGTTTTGGAWLSVAVDGSGTFQFDIPYHVAVTALTGLAEGAYKGNIAVTNSPTASDNKNIEVDFTVTSQPIAQLNAQSLKFRIGQGAFKQTQFVSVQNAGLGTLAITATPATTSSGGTWLSAKAVSQTLISITVDPTNLSPNTYLGSVALTSNAVNPMPIAVELDLLTQIAPLSYYRGAVNAATFSGNEGVAQGDIASIFGEQLTVHDAAGAAAVPLSTNLVGASVLINGQPTPLFYASYGQINFQVPYETPAGAATLQVVRDGQAGNRISLNIVKNSPRLFPLGISNYPIVINNADQSFPIPTTPIYKSHPAKVGDVLVVYAIGFGATTPVSTTGAGAPDGSAGHPLAKVAPAPMVTFGGTLFTPGLQVAPQFVGLTPGLVGLYQVNVVVPAGVQKGDHVLLLIGGNGLADTNPMSIAIQ